MQRETYLRVFGAIQSRKNGLLLIRIAGKVLTYMAALCYMAAVAIRFWKLQYQTGAVLILVPAVSFVAVSIFRKCFNAKRPYEVFGFRPLIEKDTKGKSFPSRHVFSIFVIGSTVFWVNRAAGILVCLMGCVLAVIRVVVGVHFPRDVVAGGMIGIACGCIAGLLL